MRSLLVILIFFALAEPAAACRHFSIWHYNFPQPCLIDRRETQAAPAPAALDISLPDLSKITWGETGDGRLTAIGKLRVLSSGRYSVAGHHHHNGLAALGALTVPRS
jgi:hypothetical protein